MVCFQAAAGDNAAKLSARGKHYVLFDQPSDQGRRLKDTQPTLGWVPDIDGHPALPYSMAVRLLLPIVAEGEDPDEAFFGSFVTDQLLDRVWSAVVNHIDMGADNIFKEVMDASEQIEDKSVLLTVAGDWQPIQGDVEGDGYARWLDCMTRGDVMAPVAGAWATGLAAAEIVYYAGPYMLEEHRKEGSHFELAIHHLGKMFQSDEEEGLCDGAQLASDIAEGMAETVWPDLLMQATTGPDAVADVNQRSGVRINDLRHRQAYHKTRLASGSGSAEILARKLTAVMKHKVTLPCLSKIFGDMLNGNNILDGLADLAEALHMTVSKPRIDDRVVLSIERNLQPIKTYIDAPAFAAMAPSDRVLTVVEKVEATKLSAKPCALPASSAAEGRDGTTPSSARLLVGQLTKPSAISLLQELSEYRASAEFDPTTYLEWAHTGKWPAEIRAAKVTAAMKLAAGTSARRDALAAITANDERVPVYALMQLAWGHVKALDGYPELQDIHDLGQTNMPDVAARLCARAFSADGQTVPPALRFARAPKLAAALRGRTWETDLDLCSDGDACMLSYLEGGDGTDVDRIHSDRLYTDVSQLLRIRRIGANVLAFFGIKDAPAQSWRQLVSSCEHAFQSVPASDAVKRKRLGKAQQRFVQRALGDIGRRIDMVRYTAKHDAVGPRDLLPASKGGAADEFAEAVARIQDDQRRKRSAAADDETALISVRLPAEAQSLALAAAIEPPPKRQQPQQQQPPPQQQQQQQQQQQRAVSFDVQRSGEQGGSGSAAGKYTPIALAAAFSMKSTDDLTLRVDAKGATRWLTDHGVKNPCLGFLFGHACPKARQVKSCKSTAPGHGAEATGPHSIVDGWKAAAAGFVHPQDRHLMQQ